MAVIGHHGPLLPLCFAERILITVHSAFTIKLTCAPSSTQLHPSPPTLTQLHLPPPSSFQPPPSSMYLHPAHFNLQSALSTLLEPRYPRNWAISLNLGRKTQSCLFWLKIGTHSVLEMLIPNPDLDFWNFDLKIHFWANEGGKSQSCPF